MPDREAHSNYYRVEIRLRHAEGWTPAERATYQGLLQQAAEGSGSGAVRLFIDDLISAIKAFTFGEKFDAEQQRYLGKTVTEGKVRAAISALIERGAVVKVNADWLFIPDFWGMGHSISNAKHRINIERTVNGLPQDVQRIFWETYDPDSEAQKKKQKKKQKKTSNDVSPRARREPTEKELTFEPLLERLTVLINGARKELGLADVDQDRNAALIVLRQLDEINKLTERQIEALAKWLFSADNRNLQFNLQNLSAIGQWRKKWDNGTAIIVKWEEFLLWIRTQKKPA